MKMMRFPKGFLWGTATSAHQVEGNNRNNDWWEWEKEPGHILDGSRSALACDWWNRAEGDFDLAQEMGHNAHRLSLEWSRIEPREGEWDDDAMARYRQMLVGLRERGLEPMVTLHHFTNPLWLVEKGGWETEAVVPLFERYVTRVAEELGDLIGLWSVLNEPNIYAMLSYAGGRWPPGKRSLPLAFKVLGNMLIAHGRAYRVIHRLQPRAQVGIAHAMRVFDPADPSSRLDRWAAWIPDYIFNRLTLTALTEGVLGFPLALNRRVPELVDSADFLGLNYYTRDLVAFDARRPGELFGRRFYAEGAEMSDGGYSEVYPEGLYRLLKRLAAYGKPIYVTENGLPDADDDQRPRFILTHLAATHRAIEEGAPVKGYFHWTLVDNFEWAEGWTLRFGLIALNVETQKRTIRRSGQLYQEICQTAAITEDMVERYAPEVLDRVVIDSRC
ncbi:MAG: glycoside hydrolase family 1 protein [Chloroflexi bacterium]|nr:glycoside hydrolase family 1 protein [Chloroflexota bacterium]